MTDPEAVTTHLEKGSILCFDRKAQLSTVVTFYGAWHETSACLGKLGEAENLQKL